MYEVGVCINSWKVSKVKDKAASSRKQTVQGSEISTSAGIGRDIFVRLVQKLIKYIIIILYLAHYSFHFSSETGLEFTDSVSHLPKCRSSLIQLTTDTNTKSDNLLLQLMRRRSIVRVGAEIRDNAAGRRRHGTRGVRSGNERRKASR